MSYSYSAGRMFRRNKVKARRRFAANDVNISVEGEQQEARIIFFV